MKKKILMILATICCLIGIVGYVALHIGAAIILLKSIQLWLFFVILLVPVIGDLLAAGILISLKIWWPVILYIVVLLAWQIGEIFAKLVDKNS